MPVPYEIPPVKTVEWLRPPELEGVPIPDHYVRPSLRDVEDFSKENRLIVEPYHSAHKTIAEAVTREEIESGQVEEWFRIMQDARMMGQKQRLLSGLAGPQVGISKRLVLANLNEKPDYSANSTDQLTELINPWIEDIPEEPETYLSSEGCFSCFKAGGLCECRISGILHADNLDEPMYLRDDPTNLLNQRRRTVEHEGWHLGDPKTNTPPMLVPDRIIAAIDRGELTEADLLWIHGEHVGPNPDGTLKPYSQRMKMFRAGEQVEPWPEQYQMPREQWLDIKAGRILMPRLVTL